LTKRGLEQWEDVAALVFAYLALLRTKGVPAHFIDECAKLADIIWRFQVKISSVSCRFQVVVRSCGLFCWILKEGLWCHVLVGWTAGRIAGSLAGALDRCLDRWIARSLARPLAE
jgi:hypothetical protein